jgi:hypothetical protein
MEAIRSVLNAFPPISLEETGSVKLMDRRDTKFLIPGGLLPYLLESMAGGYRVLEIRSIRAPRYETEYYDTAAFTFFRQHQTERLNRYKVRIRRYLESNEAFVELKFKNNHGRTIKERMPVNPHHKGLSEEGKAFLERRFAVDHTLLEPKLCIRFSRITLVRNDFSERVTLDIDLDFSGNGKTKRFGQLVIAEVKREGRGVSPFVHLLRERRIRPYSVSKYCLGIASIYGHVSHNLVKPKLRYINKSLYVPH